MLLGDRLTLLLDGGPTQTTDGAAASTLTAPTRSDTTPLAQGEVLSLDEMLRAGWDLESWADDILGLDKDETVVPGTTGIRRGRKARSDHRRCYTEAELRRRSSPESLFGDGIEYLVRDEEGNGTVYDIK